MCDCLRETQCLTGFVKFLISEDISRIDYKIINIQLHSTLNTIADSGNNVKSS